MQEKKCTKIWSINPSILISGINGTVFCVTLDIPFSAPLTTAAVPCHFCPLRLFPLPQYPLPLPVWLTQHPPWPWQSHGQQTVYAVSDSKLHVCSLPEQPEWAPRGGDRRNRKRTAEFPLQLFCQWRHLRLSLLSSDGLSVFFLCWRDFGTWSDPKILS